MSSKMSFTNGNGKAAWLGHHQADQQRRLLIE